MPLLNNSLAFLNRQGAENAKSIVVFYTHNFLACLVSWRFKKIIIEKRQLGTLFEAVGQPFCKIAICQKSRQGKPRSCSAVLQTWVVVHFEN